MVNETKKQRINFINFNNDFVFEPQITHPIKILITVSKKKYWYYAISLINSILKNSNEKIEFIILYTDISKKIIKKKIRKMGSNKTLFNFVNLENYIKSNQNSINSPWAYRLYIFKNNFSTINKIIYFDTDIIINGDIKEIWNIDLKNMFIGAVRDTFFINNVIDSYEQDVKNVDQSLSGIDLINPSTETKKYIQKFIGINPLNYFNSGMLVIDLSKSHSLNLYEDYLSFDARYKFNDQDFLNKKFENKTFFLNENFNYLSIFFNRNQKWFSRSLEIPKFSLSKPPLVLHYAGDKPIIYKANIKIKNKYYFFYKNFIESNQLLYFCIFYYRIFRKTINFIRILTSRIVIYLKRVTLTLLNALLLNFVRDLKLFFKKRKTETVLKKLSKKSCKKVKKYIGDALFFLDTQNAIGDSLMLLHFCLSLNSFSSWIKNKKIDFIISDKLKFLVEKISWNENINFIYKSQTETIGSHYKYLGFNESLKKYEEIFLKWSEKKYENVLFFLPWISIDSMSIISSLAFEKIYKLKFKDYLIKNYESDIVPIPNQFLSFKFLSFLNSQPIKYLNMDLPHFWGKHGSEISTIYWNDITGDNVKFKFWDLSHLFNKVKTTKDNKKTFVFMVNRPEEKTVNPFFIINLLNELHKEIKFKLIFLGLEKDRNTIDKYFKFISFDFEDLIGKTNNLEQLFEIVNSCDLVLGIDSSIHHIANILNKKIISFVNSSSTTYRFLYDYWLKCHNKKSLKIILNSEYFLYQLGHVSNYLNQDNSKIFKDINSLIINFLDNVHCDESYEINRNTFNLRSEDKNDY